MPFTDRQIAALKPKSSRYEKPEPGRTGLSIRVTPNGVKTWAFRYRFDGEQRRMVLGTYPRVGVAKAHSALAAAREQLDAGIDPGAGVAEERRAERDAETVSDLVAEYIEHHVRKKMRASSAAEEERLLEREINGEWGKRKAKDVTRRDVIKLLDAIEERGAPSTRNHVAGLLSRFFKFGVRRGVINGSPAVDIPRLEESARERVLTVDEIHTFWHGADRIQGVPQIRIALRFLLVTGQRRAEAAGTVRAEIDNAERLWRLPGARTKNGNDNIVPLPPLAMQLIEDADAHRVRPPPTRPNRKDRPAYTAESSPHLFPARRIGGAILPNALTHALIRNRELLGIGDATVHDLRRTFATYHGELGTPPEILGALMNHTPTTITGRIYNRATNIEARRAAMERWCAWLEFVIAGKYAEAKKMFGAQVTPLHHGEDVALGSNQRARA